MFGEKVLLHSLRNLSRGLPAARSDKQVDTHGEATRDPQANLREALSHSFKLSASKKSKGLSGSLVLVFTHMPRTEARPAPDRRARELRWRQDNEQLLETLAGQWLVVEGDELIAHGQDPVSLVTAARRRGIQVPFVFFVEPRTRDTVKIGL
jgi:hypothetical protein